MDFCYLGLNEVIQIMKYLLLICLTIAMTGFISGIRLTTRPDIGVDEGNKSNAHSVSHHLANETMISSHSNMSTDEILTTDLLIDDNTLDNYTIILETFNNTNIVQILGGSDFINASTPVDEVFTVLLEGNPSNGENWFISNKEALSKYISPVDIKDDGSTSKFIPEVNEDTGISNQGTFAFNFKAIQKTKESIELMFELKHAWDPLAIRTVLVSITII